MSTVWLMAKFASDVYESSPMALGGWTRSNKMAFPESGKAFFGSAYFNPRHKSAVIAFRGSVEWVDWSDADVDIAMGRFPVEQLGDAFDWAGRVKQLAKRAGYDNLFLTGHSLGGGLAQIVGANLSECLVATFNAPGMSGLLGPLNFQNKYSRIVNIRLDGDPVSNLRKPLGRDYIVLWNHLNSNSRANRLLNHKMGRLLEIIERDPLGDKRIDQLV